MWATWHVALIYDGLMGRRKLGVSAQPLTQSNQGPDAAATERQWMELRASGRRESVGGAWSRWTADRGQSRQTMDGV
jgi:hypothetical protein